MLTLRRSKPLAVLAAVALGASASLTAATPAQAVPGTIVTIGWSTATGSESTKTANAVCPAGKVILGGGADIVGGGNEVRLTAMIPAPSGLPTHSYYAAAREDASGYTGAWTMYTWAICGNPVAGWQVVSEYSAAPAGGAGGLNYAYAAASCPLGKKAIGTGAATVGGPQFRLARISFGELQSINVTVTGDVGAYAPFGVWAYAVCTNPVGQQTVSAVSVSSSINKGMSVNCPAGTKVHGVGADPNGAGTVGQLHLNRIGLTGAGALGGVDVAAHEDQDGFAGNWTVYVHAICAP